MRPETFVEGFHDADAVDQMIYNDLGKTGLKVSKIGLGGAAMGSVYGHLEFEKLRSLITYAIRHGVNYIDTAPWYGQGKSEETLGKLLKNIPRKAYYLATKVGRYETEPDKMFDFSAERTLKSVDHSLQLLGVDYVDVIQVHDMEFGDLDVVIRETLPALEKVVNSGKARFIGITGYPLDMFKYVIENSAVKIDTMLTYCRNTMLDSSFIQHKQLYLDRGIGIINASITCMGLLTSGGPQPWNPATDDIKDACRQAAELCKSKGVELAKLSVYYCSQQEGISLHLLGDTSLEIHKCNRRAVLEGISEEKKKLMEEVIKRFFDPLPKRHWEGVEVTRLASWKETLGNK